MAVTKKSFRKKRKKTRKKVSKIKKIVKIFKQYPEIFPRGYFRFLEGSLKEKFMNKEIIFKNGVVLTWKKYKVNPGKYSKYNIKKGDIKINQLVNKTQGNGHVKKIFLKFLKKHKKTNLFLDVRKNNKRAIKFYKKNGFVKVGKTKFGELPGIVMKKQTGG
tara:strand:- start:1601 stop:2083 length:483 start_codon:yes stop_codon:yes gene_type:complete